MSTEVPSFIRPVTISELSGLSGPRIYQPYLITDGDFQGDIATGSGTERYLLYHDGTNWLPLGWLWASLDKTIATGSIALPTHHGPQGWILTVDTEASAGTDDLDTVTGAVPGDLLLMRSLANTRDPTYKDTAGGSGQMFLAGDFTSTNVRDQIMLYAQAATAWHEVSRSDNQ